MLQQASEGILKVAQTSSTHRSKFYFPCPVKDETVSHPVKLWNSGRASGLFLQKIDTIFPVPKATHSSEIANGITTETASTTTSGYIHIGL